MSKTDELKTEAADARQQLVAAIGDLSGIARDAKGQAIATAKKYAPAAGGALASLVLLRVAGKRRSKRKAG